MAASFDDDTQYNYGSAPYAEAANQGRARMSTLQRIAMLLAGAGQGIQSVQSGHGPLAAGLTGFSRSYIMGNASKRAAEEYAMKQQQAEEARKSREILDAERLARTKRLEKPEPGPKPVDPELDALQKDLLRARIEATKASGAARGRTNQPKPRVDTRKENGLRSIRGANPNDPNQRLILQRIVANPPSPEEGAAALEKLKVPGVDAYRP
jgi:hypothetical protein